MRQRGVFIAVGLVLLANALVLAGVAYNRSGEPDTVMTLTEREMPVSTGYLSQENSGVSLRIDAFHSSYLAGRGGSYYDAFSWLDREKFESLGFNLDKQVSGDGQYDYHKRLLPRRTFAVLEFDGAAWDARKKTLEERLLSLDENEEKEAPQALAALRRDIERELRAGSRLFIIDAGNDPALLRNRYTDRSRYLIVPAIARVSYYGGFVSQQARNSDIRGNIGLLIDEVNVPRRLHERVGNRQPSDTLWRTPAAVSENGPSYEVVLLTGKRYEPWIADIASR